MREVHLEADNWRYHSIIAIRKCVYIDIIVVYIFKIID